MRIRLFGALALVLGLSAATTAQPPAPTVEVRVQSVHTLLDKAEYVAGLGGKEDVVQAVKQILKSLTTEDKGIEGVDPKRPFGLYVTLANDVIGSPVVAMVPIANQDRFVLMLKERLEITPEKAEGGVLKVNLPEGAKNPVVEAVYLKFANDYLYVGRSAKDLDAKQLVDPKAYFAKDDNATASLVVRGDRIPAEVKKFIIGQFEIAAAEERKKQGAGKNAVEKATLDWITDSAAGGLKMFLEDTKELSASIFIEPKSDEMALELALTPKSGSAMAKYIAGLAEAKSLPAGIVATTGSVARGSVRFGLTPDLKKNFHKLLDDGFAEMLKNVGDQEKELVERLVKTVGPTLKAGELDAAAALYGPNAKGHYSVVAAAAIKDGKEIEKFVKDVSVFAGGAADFTFDVEKIGDFSLHKIVIQTVPEDVEKIFGTKTVWLGISNTCVAVSVEPDGTAIRAGLKAKAVAVPVANLEVALAKLLPLAAKELKPDEVKALLKDAFGDGGSSGKDTVSLAVSGGGQLSVKGKVKGKGVRLLLGASLLKKE